SKISGVRDQEKKRLAIIGSPGEIERTKTLLQKSNIEFEAAISISPDGKNPDDNYKGNLKDLSDIVDAYQLNEVIFCAKDVGNSEIMRWMTIFSGVLPVKIIQEKGVGVIGSRYKNRKGEWYAIDAQMSIAAPERRRQKRLVDLVICGAMLLGWPLIIAFDELKKVYGAWWSVFVGKKTWIAYSEKESGGVILPIIKPGVFSPAWQSMDEEMTKRINYLYAKDYTPWMDLDIFWKVINR
ncbi:MAG: hypothetical protein R3275_09045, partial [Saprospiraceae bacterium]|nr:hypothetical protein [Saprospiraceae bacterium]